MSEETLDNIETTLTEEVKPEEAAAPEATEEPVNEVPVVEEPKTENVVDSPAAEAAKPTTVAGLAPVENGAIGSARVVKTPKPVVKPAANQKSKETVALFSEKNVSWPGVGKVYRGVNIVSKEASLKWSERSYIRIATPEEVAKEFGL
jgi:hypothetical protein